MSERDDRNWAATKQALEKQNERIKELENQVATLTAEIMTNRSLFMQLQQANTLALAHLRGTGATANGHDG